MTETMYVKSWKNLFEYLEKVEAKIMFDREENVSIHLNNQQAEEGIISHRVYQAYFDSLMKKETTIENKLRQAKGSL